MNWIATHYLRYRELGFSVIPIKGPRYGRDPDDTKRALIPWKEFQSRIASQDEIEAWSTEWPYASIGIVTGPISNLVAIDDDRAGKPQSLAADAFIESIERIPTAVDRTARGRHFFFRPNGYSVGTGTKVFPGIDVRGTGGYVVAAPSQHASGVPYAWECQPEDGIAYLPAWAAGVLKGDDAPEKASLTLDAMSTFTGFDAGERNDGMTSLIGEILRGTSWRVRHGAIGHALELNKLNRPPLPESEVRATFDSVLRLEERRRGQAPIGEQLTTAESLSGEYLPAPGYAIRDFIVDGTTLLFGKPKAGKSFFALQIALAVAFGRPLFPMTLAAFATANHPQGFGATRGDVLLLALEDSKRRLRDRMKMMLGDEALPSNLYTATNWQTLQDGGLAQIEAWLGACGFPRLIVIDTLAAFVGEGPKSSGNAFRADYRMLRPVWEMSQRWKVPILILDHASKGKGRMGSTDEFDAGAGTLGTQACVDSVMMLAHDDRKPLARISYKGRDIERGHFDMEHSAKDPVWKLAPPPDIEEKPSEGGKK